MRRLGLVLGTFILFLAAAVGLGRWWLDRWQSSPGPLREDQVIEISPGAGVRGIAERLAGAGILDHPLAFEALVRLRAAGRRLEAGEYAFPAGIAPAAVVSLLESGRVVQHPVTIAEGMTVREVFDLLAASPVLSGDLPARPKEGALLPQTYLVPRGEARARLVSRMQQGMAKVLAEAWSQRAPDLPIDEPDQALIVASIVERETALAAEYPLVSAVLFNRLRRGMRLQVDPTLIYALSDGRGSLGRALNRVDLAVDDPYNTYTHVGLPPAPIANPGEAALRATLQPAPVDYLYFVADGHGGHAFATTLAEHNRNVARWRQLQERLAMPNPAARSGANQPLARARDAPAGNASADGPSGPADR